MVTQKRIRELFIYCPEDGALIALIDNHKRKKGSVANCLMNKGYFSVSVDNKPYLVHRLILVYNGIDVEGFDVDHINHVRTDNRLENLRVVDRAENMKNKSLYKNNTSGQTGVNFDNRDKVWKARISVLSERVHLGSFATYGDAVNARKNAEVLYGYHENHGDTQ